MDPLKRKLFQSRDARDKLRSQGGITASFPKLAETVAKFANGGPTELQIPRVRSAIQEGGMSYPSYRMLNRSQKRELGYPVSEIGGQLAFDRFGVGLGTTEPDAMFTPTGPAREPVASRPSGRVSREDLIRTTQPVTIDRMGNLQTVYVDMKSGKIYDPSGQDFNLLLSPEEYSDLESRVNRTLGSEEAAQRRTLEREAGIAQSRLENKPSGEALTEAAAARAAVAAAPEAPSVERSAVERVLSRPSSSFEGRDVFAEEGPGASGLSDQVAPTTPAQQETGTGEPAAPEETGTSGAGAGDTDPARTGAAIGAGDFDTTFDQMLSRLEGIMGEDSDEDKKKKAMANLAMIGLAIAAGQSPDALTNIAQGALVGMKGIQEAEAAKVSDKRELKLMALKMAADEVDLRRRLQSQEKIAAMRASGGTGTYTPERLYQQNLNAILSNPDMFDVFTGDAVDPVKARGLAQQLSERGMTVGGADGAGGSSQFTPGQQVIQNGVTYEYQEDGTWKPVGE